MKTRYVLTPDPGTILDDYVQAAIAAITAISGRPLDSLDAIPERLRYLFREEVVLQCGTGGSGPTSPGAGGCAKVVIGPIKNCKVSLTGDAVKADDLGWIDTFKPGEFVDDEATVQAIAAIPDCCASDDSMAAPQCFPVGVETAKRIVEAISRGEVPGLPSPHEFAKVKAERDTFRELRDHDTETFAALNVALDELGIVVHNTYAEAIKAEVERLRAEVDDGSGTSAGIRATVLTLKAERDAANDRGDEHLNARSMMTAACEEAIAQRDAAIARLDAVSQDYQRRIGDLVLRAEKAENEVRRLSVNAGEF